MIRTYPTENDIQTTMFMVDIKEKSDRAVNYFLAGFFIAGLALAFFYNTWDVAIGVGGLSLLAYYSTKILLPELDLYQYVLSAVFGVFMAQYIYQMHGLFEMHFIAFIGSAMLITYQNWKLQFPLALVVLVHHSIFGYLQFIGYDKIYFTQLDYMNLQTFAIHITLATVVFFICGLWAHHFKKYSRVHIQQGFSIGKLEEEKLQHRAIVEMNKKLEAAKNEFDKFFNTVDEVLFSVDMKNYSVIQMSPSCKKVYGYSNAAFMADGDLWQKVMYPDDREVLVEHFANLNNGLESRNTYRIINKDGSMHWVENTTIPTMDAEGRLERIDGVTRDITIRKKAEEDVIKLNMLLEKKVKERTLQLENVNRELESFSYSVSHDLRAPLRVINGYGKILYKTEADKLSDGGKELLQGITGSVVQMSRLIDDLLEFSRLGRTQLAKSDVDLNQLVDMVIQEAAVQNPAVIKQITVFPLPAAKCDANLIKQVWVNLISNAVKYSRKAGQPQIQIGTLGTNGNTVYYIKDNGAGFDMQNADKLFKVFQRLHKAEDYEGTGVGLALAQRIITRHGGSIWAESKAGQGATFYFTLPCHQTEPASITEKTF